MGLPPPTLGVVLAGGLSRRMDGNDKALLTLAGRPLVQQATERLAPQCETVILNANGDPSRFKGMPFPVVPDSIPEHPGPLAGILAALEWSAAHRPDVAWVVSAPADTPFIPHDLVLRLHEACQESRKLIACAASGSQVHFATGLWPVSLLYDLRQALVDQGMRSIRDWLNRHGHAEVAWPVAPLDPFFNINTPEDLRHAETLALQEGQEMTELDLSGLKCPLPVLRTRKALNALQPGDLLRVVCTDPLAGVDVPNLIRETGDILEDQRQENATISFLIRKARPRT
ncbi:molybdenum cofactor guanylyltransferase MobA [Microvirga sp. 0TCS3.31]